MKTKGWFGKEGCPVSQWCFFVSIKEEAFKKKLFFGFACKTQSPCFYQDKKLFHTQFYPFAEILKGYIIPMAFSFCCNTLGYIVFQAFDMDKTKININA